jgi:hypothetical protein
MTRTVIASRARALPGRMNKTEARYAAHLNLLRAGGVIIEWQYEAVKLRLGENVHYTPDFLVINAASEVEFIEVKGRKGASYYATEDSVVKIKAAAARFPFVFRIAYESATGWMTKTIERA